MERVEQFDAPSRSILSKKLNPLGDDVVTRLDGNIVTRLDGNIVTRWDGSIVTGLEHSSRHVLGRQYRHTFV